VMRRVKRVRGRVRIEKVGGDGPANGLCGGDERRGARRPSRCDRAPTASRVHVAVRFAVHRSVQLFIRYKLNSVFD
jgi:hypothetical protein